MGDRVVAVGHVVHRVLPQHRLERLHPILVARARAAKDVAPLRAVALKTEVEHGELSRRATEGVPRKHEP